MRATRRRLNILRAWQHAGGGWQSVGRLQSHGAYGSRSSIVRAALAMGLQTSGRGKTLRLYIPRQVVARLRGIPAMGDHDVEETEA